MEEGDPMVRAKAAMSLERNSKSDQRWVRCLTTIFGSMALVETGIVLQQKLPMTKLLLQWARAPQQDCCRPVTAKTTRKPRSQRLSQKDRSVNCCIRGSANFHSTVKT